MTAKTKYGKVRLRLTTKQWRAAKNDFSPRGKSRAHIAIKVKERLNKAGASIRWLNWDEIAFSDVSAQGSESVSIVSPRQAYEAQVLERTQAIASAQDEGEIMSELFPGQYYTMPSPELGPCGCVPSRITRR